MKKSYLTAAVVSCAMMLWNCGDNSASNADQGTSFGLESSAAVNTDDNQNSTLSSSFGAQVSSSVSSSAADVPGSSAMVPGSSAPLSRVPAVPSSRAPVRILLPVVQPTRCPAVPTATLFLQNSGPTDFRPSNLTACLPQNTRRIFLQLQSAAGTPVTGMPASLTVPGSGKAATT